jgi:hypothetical protein
MKWRTALLVLTATITLSACDWFEGEYFEPRLDREYDLIVGLLTPDSLRTHPHEIFVGRIASNLNARRPPAGLDTQVNRQLNGIRNRYVCDVFGRDDAQVLVRSADGQEVVFASVGNGFYRDVQNALRVHHRQTYHLEVRYDGKVLNGTTTVPDRVRIHSPRHNDTLNLFVSPQTQGVRFDINWSPVLGAMMYRSFVKHEVFDENFRFYSFLPGRGNHVTMLERQQNSVDVRVHAMDSNYTKLYQPWGDEANQPIGFSVSASERPNWSDWYTLQAEKPIMERSTITGSADGVGVFGSYSEARLSFVIRRAN